MQSPVIKSFGGHKPDLANPPANSARAGKNYVIHQHRDSENKVNGWIESAQGYIKKFDALPANDTTIRKISNIAHENIYNLYIPEHGGKNVTIVTATYRKTGFFPASPTLDRFGVWVRPYWNGSNWIDQWRELTEMFIFELDALGAGGDNKKLYLDDATASKYAFPTIDPGGTVFAADYFKNWTIVYGAFGDEENYDLVAASGYDGSRYYLELLHPNTDFTTRTAGTKLLVYRSFLTKETPASLSSHIYGVLSEARITSGNNATDVLLMAGHRKKTFGWSGVGKSIDKLVCESATLDYWKNAFLHGNVQAVPSSDPLPLASFYVKASLVLDDGNETKLSDALRPPSGTPDFGAITQAVLSSSYVKAMATDGTYVYAATGTSPAMLFKIEPVTMTVVASLTLSNECRCLIYHDQFLYAGMSDGLAKISSVGSMSVVAFEAGEVVAALAVDDAGVFLYMLVEYAFDSYLIRRRLSDFQLDAYSVPLTGFGICDAMVFGQNYNWVGTRDRKIVWVHPGGWISGSITLSPASGIVKTLCLVGTDLYAGLNTSPAKICKVSTTAQAEVGIFKELTAGLNDCRALVYDGAYLYAGLYTAPLKVVKLEVNTWPAGEAYTFTASSGIDNCSSLVSLGTLLLAGADIISATVLKINKASVTQFALGGQTQLNLNVYASPGSLPQRARHIRLYLSEDDVIYVRVKDVGLLDTETVWEETPFLHTTLKHVYYKSATVSIMGKDYANAGARGSVQLGRGIDDSGIATFKHAAAIGRRTYAVGVRVAGTLYPNHVFATPQSGDGAPQFDVFPLLSTLNLDLEYNDGDELLGVTEVGDRFLALKRGSIVLVTPTGTAFMRDLVTKADGICSFRTLAKFDDLNFWAGYNGVYRFSTRGWQLINLDWLQEWRALSNEIKEAAIATFDRANRQYRLAYGSVERIFDVDTEEWVPSDLVNQPTRFSPDQRNGTVDFLADGAIYTLGATRHDTANFTMEYEFNDFQVALETGINALLQGVKIKYASSVDLSVQLYLDGTALGSPITISKTSTEGIVKAPLSTRCKRFHLKITATTTAVSQKVQIREINPVYEVIPSGVSVAI